MQISVPSLRTELVTCALEAQSQPVEDQGNSNGKFKKKKKILKLDLKTKQMHGKCSANQDLYK